MPSITLLAPILGAFRVVFGRLMHIQLTIHSDPNGQIARTAENDLVGKLNGR